MATLASTDGHNGGGAASLICCPPPAEGAGLLACDKARMPLTCRMASFCASGACRFSFLPLASASSAEFCSRGKWVDTQ